MSKADEIYIRTCKQILNEGVWDFDTDVRAHWKDGSRAYTIKKFGVVNTYDLQEEFPILTLRKQFLKSAIDEILWIWSKKSNNVEDLKSHVWDAWADEDKTIGKAYGYQLAKVHPYSVGAMDQVDKLLYDLKNNPGSRRMVTTMYDPHDLIYMNLEPCAWSMTFNVAGDTLNGVLNQRSQDMLTAGNWNVIQYSALLMMLAQVSGFKPGKLVHVIADAHIYDKHIPIILNMIDKIPYPAPKLHMDENVKSFYNFTENSFKLVDYRYHEGNTKFEVAV